VMTYIVKKRFCYLLALVSLNISSQHIFKEHF